MERNKKSTYARFLGWSVIIDVEGKGDKPVVGILKEIGSDGLVIKLRSSQETVVPLSKVLTCKGYVSKEGGNNVKSD